jgi:hypothetical protein
MGQVSEVRLLNCKQPANPTNIIAMASISANPAEKKGSCWGEHREPVQSGSA